MSLSDDLKRRYASGGDGVNEDGYAQTLEFNHPTLASAVYVTNQPGGFTALLEDGSTSVFFFPLGFQVRKPTRDVDARSEFQVDIVNVGKEISSRLEGAIVDPQDPIVVIYREYLLSELSAGTAQPQQDPPPVLEAPTVAVTDAVVSLSPRLVSLDRRWQRLYYTPDLYPGLAR